MDYRIIVEHPGTQHSFRVAAAVKRSGRLLRFITSVYDMPSSPAMRLAHRLVRGADSEKIARRRTEELADEDVAVFHTLLSLAVIVLSRKSWTRGISHRLDRWLADRIGVRTAKYAIRHQADAVIAFSMNERTCFRYLRKHAPCIKRIVDCANSPVDYMRRIYEEDMRRFGHDRLRAEVPEFWDAVVLRRQQEGIDATQFFLAPSEFVRQGLISCGASPEKIEVVRYGANFEPGEPRGRAPEQVRFVYVGQVTYRKGMHHLLRVFADKPEARLDVIGAWKSESGLKERYEACPNITFHGQLLHEQVRDRLLSSDVFVFDSLTEGLSLSCLEALSCGLPVICSSHSGANDLIVDGVNGFVVEPGDEAALAERVEYVLRHRERMPEWSRNAIETARGNRWSDYSDRLAETLDRWLGEGRSNDDNGAGRI